MDYDPPMSPLCDWESRTNHPEAKYDIAQSVEVSNGRAPSADAADFQAFEPLCSSNRQDRQVAKVGLAHITSL
jgi:hypothetical protein